MVLFHAPAYALAPFEFRVGCRVRSGLGGSCCCDRCCGHDSVECTELRHGQTVPDVALGAQVGAVCRGGDELLEALDVQLLETLSFKDARGLSHLGELLVEWMVDPGVAGQDLQRRKRRKARERRAAGAVQKSQTRQRREDRERGIVGALQTCQIGKHGDGREQGTCAAFQVLQVGQHGDRREIGTTDALQLRQMGQEGDRRDSGTMCDAHVQHPLQLRPARGILCSLAQDAHDWRMGKRE